MPFNREVNVQLELRGNLKKFFKDTNHSEIILDGPAGTGKTRVILERQHLIQTKYPGARGLILRKFRSSMNNTCLQVFKDDVIKDNNIGSPTYGEPYPDAPEWHERDQEFVYHNDARITVAGMDDPTKVMSSQYDWFYWNEALEARRAEWEAAMSRLRNFKVPYQQAIGDTNPGPPTHWIKQFANQGKIELLPTFHKDNPVYWDAKKGQWTDKGEAYVNRILRDGLTGMRRIRLYEGVWKSAAGQVYPDFDPEIHVIKRSVLPKQWPRYWIFDFGFVDPFCWGELVENPNTGQLILYRELYHTNLRVETCAKIIRESDASVTPFYLICDHDAENRATLEKELNYLTLPAFKLIHPGIQALQRRLLPSPKYSTGSGTAPGLVIMEGANIMLDDDLVFRRKPTCTAEEFGGYVWDTSKMDLDKYKDVPIDKDNHGMDMLRYGVCFVDSISIDPQEFEKFVEYNDFEDDELERHFRETMISQF